jgi:shikimate kinase
VAEAAVRSGGRTLGPDLVAEAVRHVVLVGLMGAGKTTVGRRVAVALGWPFVDGDEELGVADGRDAARIALDDGVAALHAREARILLDALRGADPSVIAAAASVVDDPGCRSALRGPGVFAVRLRASDETLAARGVTGRHRRDLGPDLVAALGEQARTRENRFSAVRPAVTIDVDRRTPDDAASLLLQALEARRVAP